MTIGGILAGVDGQIFRSTPPAAELVQGARPVRGLSGEDGTLLSIELPEDEDSEAPGLTRPWRPEPPWGSLTSNP